ncbi:unnamed protein product [Gulo gulo]|uniref:Uncharacterized protein n=1 Tax=Gulo gulo TaxID=48420 RepID=A0A9X9LF35_GULGU|nr:unnamed protein product [Gulo gulo]
MNIEVQISHSVSLCPGSSSPATAPHPLKLYTCATFVSTPFLARSICQLLSQTLQSAKTTQDTDRCEPQQFGNPTSPDITYSYHRFRSVPFHGPLKQQPCSLRLRLNEGWLALGLELGLCSGASLLIIPVTPL